VEDYREKEGEGDWKENEEVAVPFFLFEGRDG
jgi:hypothetical protein